MYHPQASVLDHIESRLAIGLFVEKRRLERRRLTKLLREAESMAKRRLVEPAFINGEMHEAGYIFDDISAGPHRRTDEQSFAYHPQFEEYTPLMNIKDRLARKALEARAVAPDLIREFEADLDSLIGEKPKLKAAKDAAVAPHKEAVSAAYEQMDGLKSAMDIFSNGGPSLDPLPESGDAPKT